LKKNNILVVELIICNLTRIAKSNSIIAITIFDAKDRKFLEKIVLIAREDFLTLINIAYKLRVKIVKKQTITKKKDSVKKIKKKSIKKN